MRLALKLTLALWLGIVLVLAWNGYNRFLRESSLFETDMARDHSVMGRGISAAIGTVWEDEGRERALALVERVNQRESDILIRFVELGQSPDSSVTPVAPEETVGQVRLGLIENWIDRQGDGRLFSYVPVTSGGVRVGAVELSEPLTAERAYIRTSMVRLAATTGWMAIVTGLVSVGIGFLMVGRPVRALAQRARRIGAGDFTPSEPLHQRDELGFLAKEIESMATSLGLARERLDQESRARTSATEQLRHAERLSTVGKLAAGMAHELGTPLNVISWRTKKIQTGKVEGEAARENARIANEQCDRITRIIRQILDFARQKSPETRRFDLADLVGQTEALLEPVAAKAKVEFQLQATELPFFVLADASQIQQVLTNLLVNGLQAMPAGGRIEVSLARMDAEPPAHAAVQGRRWARVSVKDQGSGIPPEALPHVFDPFFTTKGVGEGTGLGLSVAWGIVTEHGGWIEAENAPDGGARFSVYLPEESP